MKATYKASNKDAKKLIVAGRINSVKIGERLDIGNETSLFSLDFRTPVDLIEFGKSLATVSGTEFDAQIKAEAEKAAAKKKWSNNTPWNEQWI